MTANDVGGVGNVVNVYMVNDDVDNGVYIVQRMMGVRERERTMTTTNNVRLGWRRMATGRDGNITRSMEGELCVRRELYTR